MVFDLIVAEAAGLYRRGGITAWQFARGKLRGDPVYRALWEGPWLRHEGTVLDLGCGQGLVLAMLVAAGRRTGEISATTGAWRSHRKLIGIETRPRVAEVARKALGAAVEIIAADARAQALPPARSILVLDVLHMMPAPDQEALLSTLIAALEPGGVLLLREADAAAGWKFRSVAWGNRLKALAFGYSSRGFHFRSAAQWCTLLEGAGMAAQLQPMGRGTPFGNVLFVATKPEVMVAR